MKALVTTSAVIFSLLALAAGWFALRPDPLGGEPFARILIDPATRPDGGQPVLAKDESKKPARQQPDRTASGQIKPSVPGVTPAMRVMTDPGKTSLPAVPVEALVESTRYGPLPKIAADGRRPSEIYARPSPVSAKPGQGEPARIAILVNGMGLSEQVTTLAIEKLPGEVTLAFGPYGRDLQGWVRKAREAGHEVMLQIPLEPFDYPDNDPGPHTLLTSLPPEENQKRLMWLLGRFTGYAGVTNHMGAKFAAAQSAFLPVLEELRSRGLIYVDDGTSARSTAGQIARDLGLGFSVAQVQIDADRTPESIDQALARLERIAKENGFAIGIGTSLPVTVERLVQWAEGLKRKGIVLIPVSAAVRAEQRS